MPTYDYICNACGHEFEQMQSMSDEPLKICPSCEKDEVVRKISGGTGVIFKGSGFYKTDYADKKETKPTPPKPTSGGCCSGGCCNH
jgi:putative FmdB family regulatory protein